jgi:hypothetical protein
MILRQWLAGLMRHLPARAEIARCFLVVGVVCLGAVPANAEKLYDATADFSATDNPSGVWSYGWSQTLGSDFNLIARPQVIGGLDAWPSNIHLPSTYNPGVFHNGTSNTIIISGTVQFLPGQLGFHPGPAGEYAVIRWTAPRDGFIAIHTEFMGLDFVGPTTTDVHVLYNDFSIFDGEVTGFGEGSGPSYDSGWFGILAGDTIDFVVGDGDDGHYNYDSTGIDARITFRRRMPPSR